jgi:hypothetical protein
VKIKDKNSEMTTYVVGIQLDAFRAHVNIAYYMALFIYDETKKAALKAAFLIYK